MFARLFLVFSSISLLEIYVLMKVGSFLGAGATVGLVILSALVGSALVRSQGLHLIRDLQERTARGEMPGQQLIEGMMLIITGVLLVTPGFVTDFAGLLLLQPSIRGYFAKLILASMSVNTFSNMPGGFQGQEHQTSPFANKIEDDDIIEGEFERTDHKNKKA
ncbi:MAG TPA: FxsA family protein [Psychromonas hadalis]|nr:FxsA family protein [Psychromonas hadalis]